jgi:hypothetical protein
MVYDNDGEDYSKRIPIDERLDDIERKLEEIEDSCNSENNYNFGCLLFLYLPGLCLAMIMSYISNHSILWAIFHGYCSWGYVVYKYFFA